MYARPGPGRITSSPAVSGPARGMKPYRDLIDWLSGYPFEVARPEEIFAFHRRRGFRLDWLRTARGRHGCNEFVFTRERL